MKAKNIPAVVAEHLLQVHQDLLLLQLYQADQLGVVQAQQGQVQADQLLPVQEQLQQLDPAEQLQLQARAELLVLIHQIILSEEQPKRAGKEIWNFRLCKVSNVRLWKVWPSNSHWNSNCFS